MMRLNRFIAQAGICSRRKAEGLITVGKIRVNGEVITELSYQVQPTDQVFYQGKKLISTTKVYWLLHKPLNVITTLADPAGRRTVLDLIKGKIGKRVYPVGRLDRNTTGLLLLTNDGLLAQALAHPAKEVPKVYEVTLKKGISVGDRKRLQQGIQLEDGWAKVDEVTLLDRVGKVIQLVLHSGKNRVIRRLFATLDHQIVGLSRVGYAHLTLAQLPMGSFRRLSVEEVTRLKGYLG